jgi:NAD(P)H-dependent flavin oxidoreductase YrpB (nitropropane dioxygenase family)
VVAAVSKVGGLGVLGAVAHSPEALETDLRWIEDEIGDRPYGVDLIVPAAYAGDADGGFTMDDIRQLIPPEHQAFVDDILARYDVPELPPDDDPPSGRSIDGRRDVAPFSANAADAQLDISLAHRAAFVANALGPPPQFLIDRVKAEGRLVGALAGRPVHAERHQQAGVDLIIAQGYEAGGHTGEIGSMVLIPEIVDAVDIPVLGAGGIGRGRQMAAAMALGAQGVWCGSVWLTTDEAETHAVVKEKFLAATSADTIRSRSLTGKPARMLRSAWTDEWERPDTPEPLGMPLQPVLAGEAQRRIARAAHAAGSGAEKLANYFVGQIVGTMNQRRTSAQVVLSMVEEFIDTVEALGRQLDV